VFENRVLGRIFGPKRDEVMGDWRILHNEDLHNLYSLPNIIRMINADECIQDIGGEARRKETTRKTKTWVGGQY
jgi:hypothetical protein